MSSLLATIVVLLALWCALGISFWRKHRTLRERRWVYEEADDAAYWGQLAEWWYEGNPDGLAEHKYRVGLTRLMMACNTMLLPGARREVRRRYAVDGLRTWGSW